MLLNDLCDLQEPYKKSRPFCTLITSHAKFIDEDWNGRELEEKSLMGAFFSVSITSSVIRDTYISP